MLKKPKIARGTRWAGYVCSLFGWLALSNIALAGDVSREQFFSSTLGYDYPYTIYLPDGYDTAATTPYPVVYLLHGSFGNERDWATRGNLPQIADALLRPGIYRPLCLLCPAAAAGG
ncbi:alpha/beta hydrolase-fold protein [Vreelandella lionensis]|uniref:alpha/beta hydrolase-fold protein n=1 Tax=Vreelandella lionensis TaxID=1144478 RepID=UPI0030F4665A